MSLCPSLSSQKGCKNRALGLALGIFGLASVAAPASAQTEEGFLYQGGSYSLFSVPGASATYAQGINNSGQIVGSSWLGGSPGSPFVYSGGSFSFSSPSLPTPITYYGINASGAIAGISGYIGIGIPSTATGFVINNLGVIPISVPGSTDTEAVGINSSGQVVGVYNLAFSSPTSPPISGNGFLYNNGTYTTINVPGSTFTEVTGINDAGQMVGTYTDSANVAHGFFRDANGIFQTIDVPGATFTGAYGLNNSGQVVGSYVENGRYYGFLDSNGQFTTLDLAGALESYAFGINDYGQIVGDLVPGANPVPSPIIGSGLSSLGLIVLSGWAARRRRAA